MKLTVILADTYRTEIAVQFEGQSRPYGKRAVTIDLTPEQVAALGIRIVGHSGLTPRYEEVLECWIEPEPWP